MRTKLRTISLLVVSFMAACLPLLAHHGNAAYDTAKTVTIKGTVTDYIWANPHVFLKLDAKDESGNTLHWVIEGQNAVTQASAGWTNVTFKTGDQVIVDVTPAKNGRPIGRFKGRIEINGQVFKP